MTKIDIRVALDELLLSQEKREALKTQVKRLANDTTVLKDNKIGDEFISFSKERATGFMLKGRTSVGDPEIFYFRKNSAASTLNEDDVEKIDLSNLIKITVEHI